MKAKELTELTIEELRSKEKEVQETLFNLRFQHATRCTLWKTPCAYRLPKKDLARIKTVLLAKMINL